MGQRDGPVPALLTLALDGFENPALRRVFVFEPTARISAVRETEPGVAENILDRRALLRVLGLYSIISC